MLSITHFCFVLCCVVLCCAVLCCLVIFILPMKPNKLPRPSHSVLQSCSLHTNTFTVMTNRNDLRNTTLQGWLTYLSTKLPARTACQWKKRHQSAYISLIVTLLLHIPAFPESTESVICYFAFPEIWISVSPLLYLWRANLLISIPYSDFDFDGSPLLTRFS